MRADRQRSGCLFQLKPSHYIVLSDTSVTGIHENGADLAEMA
jgi:hypothetical protein